jgi:hypothetical protein
MMQGRRGYVCWFPVLALAVAGYLSAPAVAGAAVTHAFNPELSLTGGTDVSSEDPVPDPGPAHPPEEFSNVCGIAVDAAGDIYVANGSQGRIDIFDPEGHWLQEISNNNSPCALAVDSAGTLYAQQIGTNPRSVIRYVPDEYPPTSSTTYEATLAAAEDIGDIAVNRSNDHLLLTLSSPTNRVEEYASAAESLPGEENPLVRVFAEEAFQNGSGLAVDGTSGKIFIAATCDTCTFLDPAVIEVFNQSGTLLETIDGSEVPNGSFGSVLLHLAVNEENGELFVGDVFGGTSKAKPRVYRFSAEGSGYNWVEDAQLEKHFYKSVAYVAVASGGPTAGTVFATAQGSPGHSYAFSPNTAGPPIVGDGTARNLTTEEAELESEVNSNGRPTRFRIEYVDRQTSERDVEELGPAHQFDHAIVAESGTLPSSHEAIAVSAVVTGLSPGTAYYFRTVAENCEEGEPEGPACVAEGQAILFATYPQAPVEGVCPNEGFRTGSGADLPDCRAYELVTPSDTNGRVPSGSFVGTALAGEGQGVRPLGNPVTELSTDDGSSLLFMTSGGSLPIGSGNGIFDGYEAVRSPTGWQSRPVGPTGFQSQAPSPGAASTDHQFWFWLTGSASDNGSLVIGGQSTTYLRLPSGAFELVGEGPLGSDPRAVGLEVFPGGRMLLSSKVPLAVGASPAGTSTIYGRDPDGALEVISLKPSGEAPGSGAEVLYQGSSAGGSSVAFTVTEEGTSALYLRHGAVTSLVTTGTTVFAGLSEDGRRLTYLKNGDIFSFDVDTLTAEPVGSGGNSTVVNVSSDGSHVYFVSTAKLPGTSGATPGAQNLYVWDAETGELAFIATVDPLDVEGEVAINGSRVFGLGQWTEGLTGGGGGPADDPSRTTPDGRAFVFESHASLVGYDTEGHSEVYRYAPYETAALRCLSCNPTLAAPQTDAHLQMLEKAERGALTSGHVPAHNVTPDGKAVFFQTGDALVPVDVDGRIDVYEWKSSGYGGCAEDAGCLVLISSGHTAAVNALYNVSKSGSDVFFGTSDRLLPADTDPTLSIYDARVGGGIPTQVSEECAGEACKPQPLTPSPPASLGSTGTTGSGNLTVKKCKKGQRKVHRKGKVRCVRHNKRDSHHKGRHRSRGQRATAGGAR